MVSKSQMSFSLQSSLARVFQAVCSYAHVRAHVCTQRPQSRQRAHCYSRVVAVTCDLTRAAACALVRAHAAASVAFQHPRAQHYSACVHVYTHSPVRR